MRGTSTGRWTKPPHSFVSADIEIETWIRVGRERERQLIGEAERVRDRRYAVGVATQAAQGPTLRPIGEAERVRDRRYAVGVATQAAQGPTLRPRPMGGANIPARQDASMEARRKKYSEA